MKKLTSALFFIAYLYAFPVNAQTFDTNSSNEYMVWTIDGTVSYSSKNFQGTKALMPGMMLKDNVSLEVEPKSTVRLVKEKGVVTINEQGSYSLNGDLINKVAEKPSDASMYFFERLLASRNYSDQKGRLSEGGSGYGTESGKVAKKDQGGGYGTQSGKTAKKDQGAGYGTESGKTTKKDQGGGYGTESGKTTKKDQGGGYGTESGQTAKKDQGGGYGTESGQTAKKDQGGGYGTESGQTAKKDQGGGYGTESGKTAKKDQGAGYGKKEVKVKSKRAKKAMKADRFYKSSGKVQKLLMMATAMEKEGLMSKADKYYSKAISKSPNDIIAKQMYAAFQDR